MKIRAIIIFTFIFVLSLEGIGQTNANSFPNSVVGRRASTFWQVATSASRETIRSFIKTEMVPRKDATVEQRAGALERMQDALKGSAILKIFPVSESEISFIIKRQSGELEMIRLVLTKNNLIDMISLQEATEDDLKNGPVKSFSKDDLLPTIEKYLGDLSAKDEFSGSVLVAKDGKPIFSKAYGLANLETKTPNKIDTKFNIGSINKLFTMIAIGILADEGKLSIDDKLGKHLPKYPNQDARQKVTIRHLLTMSSGIGDIFGEEYEATPKSTLRTINAYLPLFSAKPLQFEPGTSRRYSNGGFLVLGAIIEKASGESYYNFVRNRIYEPIGMKDTEAYESDAKIPNMAEGYMLSDEKQARINNVSTRPARGSSGGGGYSTAPDMLKFANAVESGSFPMPNSLKQMKDRMIGGFSKGRLGFGGGAPGINASISNKIGDGYTVIVMSNYDPPSASKAGRKIRELINKAK